MTDVATPPAAEEKKVFVKPEKPDEEAYKLKLKKAEKDYADSKSKFEAARAKVDLAQPAKSADTPSGKRRAELLAQLKEIREKQAGGKAGRNKIFDEIKRTDEKFKGLIADQKLARSKTAYKSVEDIDRAIDNLRKNVDTGTMKLVDEKKALAEISSLGKHKKQFSGFEATQKQIDETKKKLADLRSTLDDPESKALSDKYNSIQTELDAIKAEQDDAYKNISSLRAERENLYKDQNTKYHAVKHIKDEYYHATKAFGNYEYQARQKQRERKKQEQEAFDKEKKLERAQKLLEDASEKAYLDEIRTAESLVRFLDPSFQKESAPLKAPSQFTASAQRTVDDSGLKGMKVVQKKEEEDYFKGTGGKKGKKGKKTTTIATEATSTAKFNCPPQVIEDCGSMGIEPPMNAADIPAVLEKVKAKLDHYKTDQDAETARRIAKAKKEVEKLDKADADAEAHTETNGHGHGETKATASVAEGGSVANEIALEDAAVKDATADLKVASIEDKQ